MIKDIWIIGTALTILIGFSIMFWGVYTWDMHLLSWGVVLWGIGFVLWILGDDL